MPTIFDFNPNDRLAKYKWESGWVKQLDLEGCDFEDENGQIIELPRVFSYKKILSIKRKPKKDKVVFLVLEEIIHEKEEFSYPADIEFKAEQEAVDFFLNEKAEMEFFEQKNKENILFDGRRYFHKISDEGEVIERIIC